MPTALRPGTHKRGCVLHHEHAAETSGNQVASSNHRADGRDSRAVDIRLTPEGRRALRRLTPLVRQANDVLFAGMSETEMAHVHRFLQRIVATSAAAVATIDL